MKRYLWTLVLIHVAGNAQATEPYSVRGLPVGITMEEFLKSPIINDDGNTDLQTSCSNDTHPERKRYYLNEDDRNLGVVECKWYSKRPNVAWMSPSEHWIDLGKGKGTPVFRFIHDGTELKLFEIKFYANSTYYGGIFDALSAKYGKPATTSSPFKTRAGGEFTSTTSTWKNSVSFIVLTFRCRHLQRYCLNFNHARLTKIYQDKKNRLDAKAAGKI